MNSKFFKNKIISILDNFNLKIVRKDHFDLQNLKNKKNQSVLLLLNKLDTYNINNFIDSLEYSQSQLGQDLFVLEQHNFKSNGFFVEFGACDGITLSNTWLLEKKFNWRGIVCEPAKFYAEKLKRNRNCNVENKCVWSYSNHKLSFNETNVKEFSFTGSNVNANKFMHERKNLRKYYVETISLNDLLEKYKCPKELDYLSIDTEGSEFEILKKLDFNKFSPKIITIEHNYEDIKRNNIFNLLKKNNYLRVFNEISDWDDWYIKEKKNQI
jgi:FkbM family methyltransferase